MPPVITSTDSITPAYFSAVKKVMGGGYMTHSMYFVGSYVSPASHAFSVYKSAVYGASQIKDPATILGVGVIASIYDGINLMGLAMQMAHSTSGPAYNADIAKIAAGTPGAVAVDSYAAGLAALKAGRAHPLRGSGRADPLQRLPQLARQLLRLRVHRQWRPHAARGDPRHPGPAAALRMSVFIEAVGFGIAAGAVIALGAVGFTVQFGISNVLNITYGALMTLAAYLGYALLSVGLAVWAALAVAAAGIALASAGLNRLLIAPLRLRGTGFVGVVIVTVAAGIIIQYCIVAIAGPDTVSYGQQAGSTVRAAGLVLTTSQLIIIGLTVAAMLALHLLLTRTQLGRAMRATSANPVVARSCGIRTERIIDVTWLISGALCGAAGVALAITTVTFDFTLGPIFLIYMIAAAVLGGIGQPYGAMLGGLVVGVGTQVAAAYTGPAYQDVYAFGLLILMLLIRPRGLLAAGTASARRLAG